LWNGCVTGPCRIFGDQRLVVLLATFNAKGDIAHDLAELILRFAAEKRLPHIISVEGLKQALELQPGEHPPRSEPEVAALLRRQMMSSDREGAHPKFYTTNTSVREAFLAAGSEATGQFTINGITGVLANEVLYTVDLEHTVVFPQYSPFYTDAAAPARAIRLLQTAFPALLDVATGSLDDVAGQQQSKLKHVVDDLEGGE